MKHPLFPSRLGDSEGDDPLLSELLDAAKSETLSPARAAGALKAFDAAKSGGAAASANGAANAARGWALKAKLGAPLAVVCAIGLGLGLGLGLGDAGHAEAPAAKPSAPVAPAEVPAPLAPAPPASERGPVRVDDLPPAPAREEAEASPPAGALPRARPPRASAAAPATSAFHAELALVETARASLARGDSEACLRALRRHQARFPAGVFAEEARVMRIEALVARGDHDRAGELGEAFLTERPNSAYAARVRSILASSDSQKAP